MSYEFLPDEIWNVFSDETKEAIKSAGLSREEIEKELKECERRYTYLDEKKFGHRGYFGRAVLVRDKETGTEEWAGKEATTWHRFSGRTLEEAEADFRSLVDGMIELGWLENRDA